MILDCFSPLLFVDSKEKQSSGYLIIPLKQFHILRLVSWRLAPHLSFDSFDVAVKAEQSDSGSKYRYYRDVFLLKLHLQYWTRRWLPFHYLDPIFQLVCTLHSWFSSQLGNQCMDIHFAPRIVKHLLARQPRIVQQNYNYYMLFEALRRTGQPDDCSDQYSRFCSWQVRLLFVLQSDIQIYQTVFYMHTKKWQTS